MAKLRMPSKKGNLVSVLFILQGYSTGQAESPYPSSEKLPKAQPRKVQGHRGEQMATGMSLCVSSHARRPALSWRTERGMAICPELWNLLFLSMKDPQRVPNNSKFVSVGTPASGTSEMHFKRRQTKEYHAIPM